MIIFGVTERLNYLSLTQYTNIALTYIPGLLIKTNISFVIMSSQQLFVKCVTIARVYYGAIEPLSLARKERIRVCKGL